ncbi:MAG: proline--tRNA ligase [Candidatus Margulisbacteria bacterium]|nr:proline--tRNA ligase [Candidatus Margulisiibacteriota bacterium]
MKFSQLLCPTLKETPREAEVVSHQLLLRAGYIRRVASGLYSFLPLGYRVLKKVEQIVREEMNATGSQEVVLPCVTPAEFWQQSGRWDKYGKELLRFKDRHDNEFCFGPTCEESITDLVVQSVKSYKQLPITLYQIHTKFRDEIRPRFGLMRAREFVMKDAYSFHVNNESLDKTYSVMQAAYERILTRCGLAFQLVSADSGQMGGDESAEFMVLAETGEDAVLVAKDGSHAMNTEVADTRSDLNRDLYDEVRGIEVGHIFKLGPKYCEAFKAVVLDETGKNVTMTMGCYGIGVSRIMAAAIEQNHDQDGIIWPMALAPFQIVILVSSMRDDALVAQAETLYASLVSVDLEVLLDDRSESVGVKFKDASLLGIPVQVVVGRDWKESGNYEVRFRKTGEVVSLAASEAISYLKTWVVCP